MGKFRDIVTLALGATAFMLPIAGHAAAAAQGEASYYGNEIAGNRTANGEICDPDELTAANRTLPLGSRVRVTNLVNGKSVIVRINDRGPFTHNRIIDLSRAAADAIGMRARGHADVALTPVDDDDDDASTPAS